MSVVNVYYAVEDNKNKNFEWLNVQNIQQEVSLKLLHHQIAKYTFISNDFETFELQLVNSIFDLLILFSYSSYTS